MYPSSVRRLFPGLLLALLSALLISCGSDDLYGPEPDRYAYISIDTYSSPGRVDLYWTASTESYDEMTVRRTAGPSIAYVALLQSSDGANGPFERVHISRGEGHDSTTISGLADGRAYWYKAIAYTALGKPIKTSLVRMTIPGPSMAAIGSIEMTPKGRWSWAPTSDSIAYIEDLTWDQGELRILDLSTMTASPIGAGVPVTGVIFDAEWSPGGQQIAYTHTPTLTAASVDYRVHVTNRTDGSFAPVSNGTVDFNGTWAGESRIYYCRGSYGPPNIYEIWRTDPGSGAPPVAVTNDQSLRKFHPSARESDGLLVFDGQDTHTYVRSLYLCRPSTGQISPLTGEAWFADSSPSWVGNASVIFTSDRSGHPEIWMMNTTSGALTQVTRSAPGTRAVYARVSPDGHKLAVTQLPRYYGPGTLFVYDLAERLP